MRKLIVAGVIALSAVILGGCAGSLPAGSVLPVSQAHQGSVGGGLPASVGGGLPASVGGGLPASVGGGLPAGHKMRHQSVGGGLPPKKK